MLARLRKAMEEREEGFTLIELLVVVIIIGILAAIAIPLFLNQRQKGYDAAIKSDLHSAALAENAYMTDNGYFYSGNANQLLVPGDANISAQGLSFSPATDYNAATQQVNVTVYNAAGAAVTDNSATGGFCLTAESASNHWFMWSSYAGGQSPKVYAAKPACSTNSTFP